MLAQAPLGRQQAEGQSAAVVAVIWQRRPSGLVRRATRSRASAGDEVDPTERCGGKKWSRKAVRLAVAGVAESC